MEQRRLRLGDILDDYCPRERRVTNHAVVAMIEENVKQTRCTTCDAEHVYKGGRAPRQRKKDAPGALYREVLGDMPETAGAPAVAAAPAPAADVPALTATPVAESANEASEEQSSDGSVAEKESPDTVVDPIEEGPVHRPLIRATLPRPEGQKEVRQVTDFTVRHNSGRGGQFRGDRSQRAQGANGSGNGNRPQGRRFPGGHQASMPGRGPGRGGGAGFRGADGPPRHGGKKRSR